MTADFVCRMLPRILKFWLMSSLLVRTVSSLAAATRRIAIIGGGASGIFSGISAAEHIASLKQKNDLPNLEIVVLEATSKTLTKVSISGGGRCNGKRYSLNEFHSSCSLPLQDWQL